jgi:hypothetical protein
MKLRLVWKGVALAPRERPRDKRVVACSSAKEKSNNEMRKREMSVDRHKVENFLYREARLMDEHAYDEWLALWAMSQ